MQEELMLALEFLDEHPEAAVRTLEQHDAAQVAAFLQQIPVSYSELVMGLSLPAFAAHLCTLLGVELSARLLQAQEPSRMVVVLRHLEPAQVDAIVRECPKSRRQVCNLMLRFPMDSVGAWMVPNTAVVSHDFSVREVLGFLKDATEDTFSKYVFVVDREGGVKGRISYLKLLKAAPGTLLGEIMETGIATIPGQLLLGEAVKLPCWRHGDVVPVTGMQHQFIGLLRHLDLRAGLAHNGGKRRGGKLADDPVSGLLDVYGKSLFAMFGAVSTAVESQDSN